jgi:RND family efflux transporter MFP subunit
MQAYEETLLFARVPGYVRPLRREIDIGHTIRGPRIDFARLEFEAGEALAEVAVPELEEETRQKHALVRQMTAEVDQAEKGLASAEAQVVLARALVLEAQANYDRWESESKRMAALAKSGVVDAQARDETRNQFGVAEGKLTAMKAAVDKARAERDKAESDVRAARSRVEVSQADAKRSETMLSYATIRAPYDGIITARKASTGDLVQPAGTGDWLFRVARLDPIRVVLAVPEADAELVKEGYEVRFNVQGLLGRELQGKVTRTSWTLDPASRTLRTEIEVVNKDHLLRPGAFVSARIICPLPESWTLPASAIVRSGDSYTAWRIEDGKAVRIDVQTGRGDGQSVAVLKWRRSGATPDWMEFKGDEAIAARAAGLTDGQAVRMNAAGK